MGADTSCAGPRPSEAVRGHFFLVIRPAEPTDGRTYYMIAAKSSPDRAITTAPPVSGGAETSG
jgi:hypothetical protein